MYKIRKRLFGTSRKISEIQNDLSYMTIKKPPFQTTRTKDLQ